MIIKRVIRKGVSMNQIREMKHYEETTGLGLEALRKAYVEKSLKCDKYLEIVSKILPLRKNLESLDQVLVQDSKIITIGQSKGVTLNKEFLDDQELKEKNIIRIIAIDN